MARLAVFAVMACLVAVAAARDLKADGKGVSIPQIPKPSIGSKNISVPTVSVPKIAMPTIGTKNISLPTGGSGKGITVPKIEAPKIEAPTFSTKQVSVPTINIGKGAAAAPAPAPASSGKGSKFTMPQIAMPTIPSKGNFSMPDVSSIAKVTGKGASN